MCVLYNFLISAYNVLVFIVSLFGNRKAKMWWNGRRNIFSKIQESLQPNEKRIWIHAASLGEFEQGRPIIEKIKKDYPQYKIFLTFFSPSGYEVRKDYSGADYIFYLPADTPFNVLRFLDLVNPAMVFFVKYEFWYNYLSGLKKRNIPVYLCSAIFRPEQLFFKWYGGWYRKNLTFFTHLFVQTDESVGLLSNIGITNVSITGDTRFDRVYAIATQAREISEVKIFVGSSKCLVAGSTWLEDEDVLARYINSETLGLKYIVAPHEIDEEHLLRLEQSLQKSSVRFSSWLKNPEGNPRVLIIDNIGMLSSLYRYGQVAYIGGGFGKGIHNILEAATFGLPVLFGPNYSRFGEAVSLVASNGAFAISDFDTLKNKLNNLFADHSYMKEAGNTAAGYVKANIGATNKILDRVFA
jgi:3-deoxy-D-manno-octulosonic-acid transferase